MARLPTCLGRSRHCCAPAGLVAEGESVAAAACYPQKLGIKLCIGREIRAGSRVRCDCRLIWPNFRRFLAVSPKISALPAIPAGPRGPGLAVNGDTGARPDGMIGLSSSGRNRGRRRSLSTPGEISAARRPPTVKPQAFRASGGVRAGGRDTGGRPSTAPAFDGGFSPSTHAARSPPTRESRWYSHAMAWQLRYPPS